jgi:hypothetical protein
MSRKSSEKSPKQPSLAGKKAERLAEALRANLRRRKAAGRSGEADSAGKPQAGED